MSRPRECIHYWNALLHYWNAVMSRPLHSRGPDSADRSLLHTAGPTRNIPDRDIRLDLPRARSRRLGTGRSEETWTNPG